jgi:hypothetical protein
MTSPSEFPLCKRRARPRAAVREAARMMALSNLPPPFMAAAIAQLLDEQREILAELRNGPYGQPPLQAFLVLERIDWLEEELAMRLPPGPG